MNITISFDDFIKEIVNYMVENKLLTIGGVPVSGGTDNDRNEKRKQRENKSDGSEA